MPPAGVPAQTDLEWDAVIRRLDRAPHGDDFNTAHEICSRYAGGSKTAITILHPDGSRERWSHSDLDHQASRLARVFAANGLRPGDRVGGLLSRQIETWITAIAAWRSGLVFVPLFGGFGADAIGLRLAAADVHTVVADANYLDTLDAALTRHGLDPYVLVAGRTRAPRSDRPWFWAEVAAASPDGPLVPTHVHDIATVLFTSGTTGTPKGCAMPHGALISVLPYVRHVLGIDRGGPVFATADPGWAYGLYTTGAATLALGHSLVMYAGTSFVPEDWHRVVVDEQVSIMATAPSAVRRLTSTFREHGVPSSLRTVAVAGESLPEAVAVDWAETGAPTIRNGYGLSELGMVLGDLEGSAAARRAGTLAGPIPGFDAFLSSRTGEAQAPGAGGLVAVRRPRFMMSTGYLNAPEEWARRWVDDVFITEDRAVVDESTGAWTIVGRDDDIMVIAGHNVSPVEVESAVLELDEIVEAAAVSHADPQRGDVIRVVAVLAGGTTPTAATVERIERVVATSVGKYAVPRVVEFAASLPRTEVGKLRRRDVRSSPVA